MSIVWVYTENGGMSNWSRYQIGFLFRIDSNFRIKFTRARIVKKLKS